MVQTRNNSTFCYEVGLNHPVGPGWLLKGHKIIWSIRNTFKSPSIWVFVCLCPLVKTVRHLTADLVAIKTRQTFFRSFLVLPTKITTYVHDAKSLKLKWSSASGICWGFQEIKHLQHFIWVHEWMNEWMNEWMSNTFASFLICVSTACNQMWQEAASSPTRSRREGQKKIRYF